MPGVIYLPRRQNYLLDMLSGMGQRSVAQWLAHKYRTQEREQAQEDAMERLGETQKFQVQLVGGRPAIVVPPGGTRTRSPSGLPRRAPHGMRESPDIVTATGEGYILPRESRGAAQLKTKTEGGKTWAWLEQPSGQGAGLKVVEDKEAKSPYEKATPRQYLQGKRMYKQDRVYNKETGEYENRGEPYLVDEKDDPTGAGGDPLKTATALRGEFVKGSKTFVDVRDAYRRVESSAENPSAAGDLSMIFNYMKVLDPESVVREGEFATAANTGSVPQRIWAQYNKVLRGERLTEVQRKDFLGKAKDLYKKQENAHQRHRRSYTQLSKDYNVDPKHVVLDYVAPEDYEVDAVYEMDNETRARFKGFDRFGEPIWEPVQ